MNTRENGIAQYIALLVVGAAAAGALLLSSQLGKFNGNNESQAAATTDTTTEFSIGSRSAIANQDGNQTTIGSNQVWIGTGQNGNSSYIGMYFTGGSIPSGAIVKTAVIDFTAVGGWTSLKEIFYADKNNSGAFSNSSKPSSRTLTSANNSYADNVKWNAGTVYSYEVTNSVKELVGTQGANSITIIGKGVGGSWGRKYVYGNPSTNKSPKLRVTYTITQSPTPTATPGGGIIGGILDGIFPSTRPSPTPTEMPMDHTSGNSGGNAHALGLWNPTRFDTCPNSADTARIKEIHDSYKVLGPDGKWYPTWHPPVDPTTGCKFGHEHGRDPKQSPLWSKIQQQYGYDADHNGTIQGSELDTAGLPFGYVNEAYMAYNMANGKADLMRHEDHVGHKVEWEVNVSVDYSPTTAPVGGSGRKATGVTCSFLIKAHQGTHSKDALSNNLHEVLFLTSCNDGQDLRLSKLVKFGKAGEFTRFCDINGTRNTGYVTTGYANSSADFPGSRSDGDRMIIDRACVEEIMLVPEGRWSGNPYEAWPYNMNINKKGGASLVSTLDLLLDVEDSIRYYKPGATNNIGYFQDLCYEVLPNGNKTRGGTCDLSTNYGALKDVTWDDPRAGFKDLHRGAYVKPGDVSNGSGPTTWYTDPFGENGQTTAFPGALKQYIVQRDINYGQKFGGYIEPNVIDRRHVGTGVHAPN